MHKKFFNAPKASGFLQQKIAICVRKVEWPNSLTDAFEHDVLRIDLLNGHTNSSLLRSDIVLCGEVSLYMWSKAKQKTTCNTFHTRVTCL